MQTRRPSLGYPGPTSNSRVVCAGNIIAIDPFSLVQSRVGRQPATQCQPSVAPETGPDRMKVVLLAAAPRAQLNASSARNAQLLIPPQGAGEISHTLDLRRQY